MELQWICVAVVLFFIIGDIVVDWIKEIIAEFRK